MGAVTGGGVVGEAVLMSWRVHSLLDTAMQHIHHWFAAALRAAPCRRLLSHRCARRMDA